jgi:hypothetical protein
MRRILGVDAGWDLLMGVALCLIPWLYPGFAGAAPWFVGLGLGCIAVAFVMVRAAQGVNTADVCRIAAVGNAIAALAVMVCVWWFSPLGVVGNVIAAIVAVVCAGFAVLEWGALKRPPRMANGPNL